MQPLGDLRDLQVDLGVRELLTAQPVVEARDAVGETAAPIAVGFESGGKIAGWVHSAGVFTFLCGDKA